MARLYLVVLFLLASLSIQASLAAETVALWLFDEPVGSYPSSVLDSSSENDYPLVLGQSGQIVKGRFGNALSAEPRAPIVYSPGPLEFGLSTSDVDGPKDSRQMTWANNHFTALMTNREEHLRNEVGFVNAAHTRLNLGNFDWTVEFWFSPGDNWRYAGTLFELAVPADNRNDLKTCLSLAEDRQSFIFQNDPSQTKLEIATDRTLLSQTDNWCHLAFSYTARDKQLRHFVNGRLQQLPGECSCEKLPEGQSSHYSVGNDCAGEHPLQGALDELRISTGQVYRNSFAPPESFAPPRTKVSLINKGPLLFGKDESISQPIELGTRKHVFIDDALLESLGDASFVVNPPRRAERVIDGIEGVYRKHLTVVEDSAGAIRIYNGVASDYLAVSTSPDGVHFSAPKVAEGTETPHKSNPLYRVVIPEQVGGLGNPFIDPSGPDSQRWKYFSDYHRRGIYLYTSPDGYHWERHRTAILPFRSGTQSCTFYDNQRQLYVSYHRSGIHRTPAGDTERSSVVTEHRDLCEPLEFAPLTQAQYLERKESQRLREPLPWYLDNGPLTPGGFGLEFPPAFCPRGDDPVGTDIYVTKAQKYPWALDTYLAFPIVYFHYGPDGPAERQALGAPARGRGSGSIETQIAVSRDGRNWKRYPRPAYVGMGEHQGREVVTAYLAHGMVRRGVEIWQYYFGETQYHSAYRIDQMGRGVYRLIQRLDGFVSLDSPYEHATEVVTRPLRFSGNRLNLNVDTDATGYVQVGLLDEHGCALPGYSLDDCIYVNGDSVNYEVSWMKQGSNLSDLAGQTVQLVFRMRGSKLYALQFVKHR